MMTVSIEWNGREGLFADIISPEELTFIVLAKIDTQTSCSLEETLRVSPMVGDVNLFLSEGHSDEDDGSAERQVIDAELEVMIAGEKGSINGFIRCLDMSYRLRATLEEARPGN